MDSAGIFLFENSEFGWFFRLLRGLKAVEVWSSEVSITNCLIHNLFAKKVLMLYNYNGFGTKIENKGNTNGKSKNDKNTASYRTITR